MDWEDIKLLLEAGRAGSFTAAASRLNIHQASVSRRISALEHKAGTALFRRSKTGAVLTEAGERLLAKARAVEEQILDFEKSLHALKAGERQVAVSASEGVSTYLLAPLSAGAKIGPVGVMLERVPDLRIGPIRMNSEDRHEPADIGLVWSLPGTIPAAGVTDHVRRLATVRFTPFYSVQYLNRKRRLPKTFEEIRQHPLITHSAYSRLSGPDSFDHWGKIERGADQCVTVDFTSSVERLLRAGAGITLLPTYSGLYSEDYRRLEVESPIMDVDLWICADADALRVPAVRHTFDEISRGFHAIDWKTGF